jgi:hypothetical protein
VNTLLRRPRSRAAIAHLARVEENAATRRAALQVVPRALEAQFSPAAATGLSTVYELRVLARDGAVETRFALQIEAGRLRVQRRPAPEAAAWVAVGLGDMIRLLTGETAVWPLMARKRLDIGGEPFRALRFPALFGL